MSGKRNISLYDRLEIHHLEAYYGLKTRAAQKKKQLLLDYFSERRTGILTFWDLAEFDGYDGEEMQGRFLKIMKRCLKRVRKF